MNPNYKNISSLRDFNLICVFVSTNISSLRDCPSETEYWQKKSTTFAKVPYGRDNS